jgi:hypothetical protein
MTSTEVRQTQRPRRAMVETSHSTFCNHSRSKVDQHAEPAMRQSNNMAKPGNPVGEAIATAAPTKVTPKPLRRNSDSARTTKSPQQTIQAKHGRLSEANAQLKSCVQELRRELNGLRACALGHADCDCPIARYNQDRAKRIAAGYYSFWSSHGEKAIIMSPRGPNSLPPGMDCERSTMMDDDC